MKPYEKPYDVPTLNNIKLDDIKFNLSIKLK